MKGIDDFVDILSQGRKKDKNLDVREASSSYLRSSYLSTNYLD